VFIKSCLFRQHHFPAWFKGVNLEMSSGGAPSEIRAIPAKQETRNGWLARWVPPILVPKVEHSLTGEGRLSGSEKARPGEG
jgi:hypothetical protein